MQKPIRNPYTSTTEKPEVTSFQHQLTPKNNTDFNWLGVRMKAKPSHIARFWSQNINGISTSNNLSGFNDELMALSRYDIQFLALTEINVNTSNAYIRDTIEHVTQVALPASRISMSSNLTDNNIDLRQYGGTLSVAHGMLASRVACCGRDTYGRFSWIQFFGKKYHLKVYTVYNPVPHQDSSKHDSAVWVQQRNILQKNGIETNPNEHLLSTLLDMIEDDISKNRQVMVLGDFNFNIFDESINNRFSVHGLVNPITDHIDSSTSARSFFRGRHIIDGLWCTQLIRSNIRAIGFAPFTFELPSDHRGLYVDLDVRSVLDEHDASLLPLPYRRLKSTVPSRVDKYSTSVGDGWFLYNIYDKINQLEDAFLTHGPSDENMAALNKLDDQIGSILQTSEIKCCNVSRHDSSLYSTKLSRVIKKERLLKSRLRRVSMRQSFKRSTPVITTILKELKEVRREKRDAKRDDVNLRDKHLDECAAQYVRDHPGAKIENVVKQLQHIEKQQREAARIRLALKGRFEGALTYVLVPALSSYSDDIKKKDDFNILNMNYIWDRVQVANGHDIEEWEIINDKNNVEKLTLECLKKHFGQAQGTPFTSDFWVHTLTDEDEQNKILSGEFDLSTYPKSIQLYLAFLQRPKDRKEIPFTYTFAQFCSFISKSKEKTSTSPSGRHYGHYKVLLNRQYGILHDIYRVMKLGFTHGILLDRYKRTITTLICKETGRPRIHRLRPIHIIEAELQALTN